MERRTIIQGLVATGTLGISAGVGLTKRRRRATGNGANDPSAPPGPTIADDTMRFLDALRDAVAPLKFEQAALLRFVHDHADAEGSFGLPNGKVPRKIAQRLLLSSDLFQRGGVTDQPLAYIRYYDPYISVCHNPLRPPP